MKPEEIQSIELRLGYAFVNKALLIRALTRKAAAQEKRQKGQPCEDQEVFCTLGDTVLKAILTDLLIEQGQSTRGTITRSKEQLENEKSLGRMLRSLQIKPIVGIGERAIGVQEQSRALAETFEAIVAAIYKDGGYEVTKERVTKWFGSRLTG